MLGLFRPKTARPATKLKQSGILQRWPRGGLPALPYTLIGDPPGTGRGSSWTGSLVWRSPEGKQQLDAVGGVLTGRTQSSGPSGRLSAQSS